MILNFQTTDRGEFWSKLSAVNEVANQLQSDLEDCNKLLQDADLSKTLFRTNDFLKFIVYCACLKCFSGIDGLRKVEYSQEIQNIAEKQGKTLDDLKSEVCPYLYLFCLILVR